MGYDETLNAKAEQELLLDVSNILVGAILNGVTNTLVIPHRPSWQSAHFYIKSSPRKMYTGLTAALMEVNYSLKDRNFRSHLLLFMAEEAIEALRKAVDNFVESL